MGDWIFYWQLTFMSGRKRYFVFCFFFEFFYDLETTPG